MRAERCEFGYTRAPVGAHYTVILIEAKPEDSNNRRLFMQSAKRKAGNWVLVLLLALSFKVSAQETPLTAYETVSATTARVMVVLKDAETYADQDPQRYYDALRVVMDDVVDYRGFARGVMGPFASKQYYDSLSDDGKTQLRQQLEDFTAVMRENLIETYAKGLIAFAKADIEVVRPDEDASRRASIVQRIKRDSDDPYTVLYQMGQNRDGSWQLRNVIIEDVNLGEIYRSQFDSAAKRIAKEANCADGDMACIAQVITTVITTWGQEG